MALFDAWDYTDETSAYRNNDSDDDNIVTLTKEAPKTESDMFELITQYAPNNMKSMAISSDIVIMGLGNCTCVRLDLKAPEALQTMEICKKKYETDNVHRVFCSPNGDHQLISMRNGDNYYLHTTWTKPKLLTKLKSTVIESVGWNKSDVTSSSTGSFLAGTTTGALIEVAIEIVDKSGKPSERVRPVYQVSDSQKVTGIIFEVYVTPSGADGLYVMATTPVRILQFIGTTFDSLFSNPDLVNLVEVPGGLNYSELCFFCPSPTAPPKYFAWLTEPGLYVGQLSFGNQAPSDSMISSPRLIPYVETANEGDLPQPPISVSISEFHYILAYASKYQVVNRLNNEVVFQANYPPKSGNLIGVKRDHVGDTHWMVFDDMIYELVIKDEDRNVWRQYLEKGQYELALQYTRQANHRDKVLTAQADHYYELRQFERAASFYARTANPFEEVALKFITTGEKDALRIFLSEKLSVIRLKDLTQLTIICTWLTELYLNRLNELDASVQKPDVVAQKQALVEEFHNFLSDYTKNFNVPTTFTLISSHGRVEDLLYFAEVVEDYDRVLSHHIQAGSYDVALAVLKKQAKPQLYYKFSPVLMHHVPGPTVNSWIWAGDLLDPRLLIPALMRYNPTLNRPGDNQAIRYLEHCVGRLNCTDPSIHNYLLSLYAQQDDDTALLLFLDAPNPCFDLKYALRLCTKLNKTLACIHIYSAMELYEEAVSLALTIADLDLAILNANKPTDDEDLRRKLWLRIARFVVETHEGEEGHQAIKTAISFINQYDVLKIEDILPFFPDFVLIADFKEEICTSLEEYNRHIGDLKTEMDDATKSADLIRKDIRKVSTKYGFVGARQACSLCGYSVLSRAFYLFPCQHVFHCDCFRGEVLKTFPETKKARVAALMEKYHSAKSMSGGEAASGSAAATLAEDLRTQIDNLVAEECVLCGEIMVKSIERPFFDEDDFALAESWEV